MPNSPQFRNKQMGSHLVPQLLHRQYCLVTLFPRNQVLGLELGPAAGREIDAEMRQPLVPRAGNPQLFRTAFRRMSGKRMEFPGSQLGPG